MTDGDISRGRALAYGLGAHLFWGSMPLYLLLVQAVPAGEYVAWRTLLTLPICLAVVWHLGRAEHLKKCLTDRTTLLKLLASSALIAINWWVYVWAIQSEYVYAASLGYYILPIVIMVLGLVFLGERLSRLQWCAVGLAAIGVAALASGALTTLWISLVLGLSFAFYGLIRKTVAAGPLEGLTVEAIILLPLVLAYLGWSAATEDGLAFGRDGWETVGILLGGPMTAIPLILFAAAARALPYTTIGFIQFTAPTLVFLLGLTVFDEALKPAQLICFIAIWSAVAIFSWDIWRKSRASRLATAQPV
ncbi:EamA family transporter RarD [Aurantiacibacter aquimixticola]|uniref:EamA family transporter RarD n=1 Tax=Aurantiacibacter aquimixticola TaxID=1958945 RepID=A0A419RQH8_9SPHN|nr:EamA family transporter RarD [Aurantiacibacter aquimixticola]RJY08020.1 EamA family transporter RarD [Aurantiacibacter aquimixticola]